MRWYPGGTTDLEVAVIVGVNPGQDTSLAASDFVVDWQLPAEPLAEPAPVPPVPHQRVTIDLRAPESLGTGSLPSRS